MSMLAERRQKMKFNPNPCGNLWAKDTNKFGQKILEKFGWTPGKGLGVQEQGITDPVRLKCNSTQKGLGFERSNKTDFFQHQEEFSSILLNLNSQDVSSQSDNDSKTISLEEKSKNCKTRVHYHKFTRGKDISRYSEKDLSCILGSFQSIQQNISKNNETVTEETSLKQSASLLNNKDELSEFEVSLTSKKSRKRKQKDIQNDQDSHISNDQTSLSIECEQNESVEEYQMKKKRKKKSKRKYDELEMENRTSGYNCDTLLDNGDINSDDNVKKSKVKKKRNKK